MSNGVQNTSKRRGENALEQHRNGNGSSKALNGNGNGPPKYDSQRAGKYDSHGFWNDLFSLRWTIVPETSAKMLGVPMLLYLNWSLIAPTLENPFSHFLFITAKLPDVLPEENNEARYGKSYWDFAFLAYYIVFWSFVRQVILLYFLHPLARYYGIKKEAKVERFGEQGYAVLYNTFMGSFNFYIMYYHLPTWYFKTEHFWLGYPYWRMTGAMKIYYLTEAAYWCQQFILIALKIEKPRKDYYELVVHHIVTIWLIGWSYLVNMTPMGNAVFLTMDWSDVFLSLAKCFNYLKMERTKTVAFAWFVVVWTYTRHYLNLRILWATWYQYDLLPSWTRSWTPKEGIYMPNWMQMQIFIPLAILQALNLFWYFFIWRILLRALFSSTLDDERSDDEDEQPEAEKKKKK